MCHVYLAQSHIRNTKSAQYFIILCNSTERWRDKEEQNRLLAKSHHETDYSFSSHFLLFKNIFHLAFRWANPFSVHDYVFLIFVFILLVYISAGYI